MTVNFTIKSLKFPRAIIFQNRSKLNSKVVFRNLLFFQIDRLLPVAGIEQKSEFSHLFNTTSQKNLSDGHLWFSVFLRPVRSRFTRVQRVSCCMALLYLSMLVNAMWYQRVPDKPGTGALSFGPFSLSPEQVSQTFTRPMFSHLV